MATIYRIKSFPGHKPSKKELDAYIARLSALGQIVYYRFSVYGRIEILITGIFFTLAAIGIAVVLFL